MAMAVSSLHSIPIKQRPPPDWRVRLHSIAFNVSFGLSLLLIHSFQLVFLPLRLIPHPYADKTYHSAIIWAKEAFASDLVFIVSVFGPSKFVLTADDSIDLNKVVRQDASGRFAGFDLATQAVWISNHQCYTDWIFPWIFMSYGSVSAGLVIILQAALEWAPIVGPAMQLFNFCFIDKKKTLAKSNLFRTAQAMLRRGEPYQALLFPEGTLYSSLTRPRSAKYAEQLGIPDATNVLLPRSAGMLFTLRCLLTIIPRSTLALYDITMGYPGVPAQAYAQDYYTLQSVFGRGVSAPAVHIHLRQVRLEDVPLGAVRESARPAHLEGEITPEEKKVFEEWLRARWEEKDKLMGEFGAKGEFPSPGGQGSVEVEIKMRTADWVVLASVPVVLAVAFWLVKRVVGLVF
ncbi:hypothetical protein JCM6882_000914 [Rhodosporidiobolus microsporus]